MYIRNHLAHRSVESEQKYSNVVIRYHGTEFIDEVTVGEFLLSKIILKKHKHKSVYRYLTEILKLVYEIIIIG